MILGRISTTTVVVGEVIQIIQFCDKKKKKTVTECTIFLNMIIFKKLKG